MRCFDCFNLKAGDFSEIGKFYEAEITRDAKFDEVWQRIWDSCNISFVIVCGANDASEVHHLYKKGRNVERNVKT